MSILTEPRRACFDHKDGGHDAVCSTCRLAYQEQQEERGQARPPATDPVDIVPDDIAESDRSLLGSMRSGSWLDAQVFPPLEWIVEGILPEGFGLLVAPPKAGKSWMVAGIGLACATGGFAFGKIGVKPRPVLYLALEDGHRRLQSRFRMLTEGAPIAPRIHVIISAHANEVPGMIAEFLSGFGHEKPLVILDTLGKVKPPKQAGQESYNADYAIGSQLKALVDSVPGSCLLAVHHTRKAESADFVDAVSGTHGIAGSADFVLVLSRKRKDTAAVLAVTGRDLPEDEYALVTQEGQWTLDGQDLRDAAATVGRRGDAQKLGDRSMDTLAFVAARPGGTRPNDLAEHLEIDADTAGKYLRRLADTGRVGKKGRGIFVPLSEVSEPSEGDEPSTTRAPGIRECSDGSDGSDTYGAGGGKPGGGVPHEARSTADPCPVCGQTLGVLAADVGVHPDCVREVAEDPQLLTLDADTLCGEPPARLSSRELDALVVELRDTQQMTFPQIRDHLTEQGIKPPKALAWSTRMVEKRYYRAKGRTGQ
ncbi:AAA family ATPase [Nocardia salmonicida]|uniref:AAA family ATPase n=1 Tax=Nocardia salmonicida TaxID=53431 RepID=UPI00340F63E3